MRGRLLDPTDVREARLAGYRRHLEIVAWQLKRMAPDQLRRLLLKYERCRMIEQADLVRDAWAAKCPHLRGTLAREASEYARRLAINAQDSRDYLGLHRALKTDLAGRDLAGVEHECEMYERLGWQITASICRIELQRRREAA